MVPDQSVASLLTEYPGTTESEREPRRAPVIAIVPEEAPLLPTDCRMRRIASVIWAGVLALMNSPRVLTVACQMSSMVLRWFPWYAGQEMYGCSNGSRGLSGSYVTPRAPSVMP